MSYANTIRLRVQNLQQFVERLLPMSHCAATAKKRLQMLKLQDRGVVTPRECDELRRQIQAICAEHGGIDAEAMDLRIDNTDGQIAVIACIPVKRAAE